jgi:4-hydroxy-tetrahydrodipicolinate reductase
MKQFSLWAAKYINEFELIDYASAKKPDVPSGTVQELAECLGDVQKPQLQVPIDKLHGPKETRGAEINGVRVHSVRLPGYILSCEAIFGMPDEKLTIRHDAGSGAQPYVAGTILAIKKVQNVKGIVRGLNTLLFE